MPNVNSQTIYQMGSLVNDVVKQATGRDPVQSIEMANVTVAQNTLLGIETQSGSVVSFVTPRSVPLLTLEAQIVAQQDLHGYDYPWPGGGGSQLLNVEDKQSSTVSDVTFEITNTTIIASGTTSAGANYVIIPNTSPVALKAGQYTFSITGNSNVNIQIRRLTGSPAVIDYVNDSRKKATFTLENDENIWVNINVPLADTEVLINCKIKLEAGATATDWIPYSNICPITGFTGCNITVSDGDTTEHVYPVEWETEAGTVYGGVLDAKNGKLTIDRKLYQFTSTSNGYLTSTYAYAININDAIQITSNNQTTLIATQCDKLKSGTWANVANQVNQQYICSCVFGKGIAFRVPGLTTVEEYKAWLEDNPLDIVYLLNEPVEYEVTPVSINTLAGENVISADTGDISLSYYVYTDLL